MNDIQKKKRNFRDSKIWKLFKKRKKTEQKNLCYLSKEKLSGSWSLHHRKHSTKEAENQYTNLSNKDLFICLSKKQHKLLHDLIYCYIKYGRDDYLKRLFDEVKYEVELNNL